MTFLEKLLSDNNDVSSMRLMSFISLVVGSTLAFCSMYRGCGLGEATPAIGVFIGAAFGGKVWQKYAENNNKKPEVDRHD